MSEKRELRASRFVIPFGFDPKDYEALDQAIAEAKGPQGGLRFRTRRLHQRENQFFPFFSDGLDPDAPQGVGKLWELDLQPNQIAKGRIFYRKPKEKKEYVHCKFEQGGLGLFKTGVGLAWFQLEPEWWPDFPERKGAGPATVEQMIEVNNYVKDICHRTLSSNPTKGGQASRLICFPQRPYDEAQGPGEGPEAEELFLFDWVWELLLAPMPEELFYFFAPRRQEGYVRPGPDKAHIFSAITRDAPPEEDHRLLYWLRKGYKPSYRPAEQDLDPQSSEVLRTFDNVTWTACFEGCAVAFYRTGAQMTDQVFQDHGAHIWASHFILYLMALLQYYTLQRLSAAMALLPCHVQQYNEAERSKLIRLQEELGEAYAKIFYPRVSYIGHQNRVYDLFCQALDIRLLQEELTRKAQAAREVLESYRERRWDRWVHAISITGGVFVVLQTLGTLLGIYDMEPALAGIGRWAFSVVVMLVSLMIGWLVAAVLARWKGR